MSTTVLLLDIVRCGLVAMILRFQVLLEAPQGSGFDSPHRSDTVRWIRLFDLVTRFLKEFIIDSSSRLRF